MPPSSTAVLNSWTANIEIIEMTIFKDPDVRFVEKSLNILDDLLELKYCIWFHAAKWMIVGRRGREAPET